MAENRRPIREMSQRRRHDGLSPFDLQTIQDMLSFVLELFSVIATLPPHHVRNLFIGVSNIILDLSFQMGQYIRYQLDPINPDNKNRDINLTLLI